MARNPISVAVAAESEISAYGFVSIGEAVSHYSDAAANGFEQCRFVPVDSCDAVSDLIDDDYVLLVVGQAHKLRVGLFSDRPMGLKGWILFSHCNYAGSVTVSIDGFAGGEVCVDNYMCDQSGKPVLSPEQWEFKDYFGDTDTITIEGVIYRKAWDVVRNDVPYQFQTNLAIKQITYLSDLPHTLPDGAVLDVAKPVVRSKTVVLSKPFDQFYEQIGSPYMTNGTDVMSVLSKPRFLHGYVKCVCGVKRWTVGDWHVGYNSPCCGVRCNPLCVAAGYVEPGDVVITTTGSGSGIKYYKGLTLKFVGEACGVALWRVTKTHSVDGFVACGRFVDDFVAVMDDCSVENSTSLACALKYGILSGSYSSDVVSAVKSGLIDLSLKFYNAFDELFVIPNWLNKLGSVGRTIWEQFKSVAQKTIGSTGALVEFVKSVAKATCVVVGGSLDLVASVPAAFTSLYETLRGLLRSCSELFVDQFKIAGVCFKRLGDYVLFDNALCQLVSAKIKGSKQDGLKSATYASVLYGPTKRVSVRRVERSNANLAVVDACTPPEEGSAVVIGEQAFYTDGEHFWFLTDHNSILEAPCFGVGAFQCPELLSDVDGGSIYQAVFSGFKDASACCASLKVQFGLEGFSISAGKKFKAVASALATRYNEYASSVAKAVRVAGVTFTYYAFEKPMLAFNGTLVRVSPVDATDFEAADSLKEFMEFKHVDTPISASKVTSCSCELQEIAFVEPKDGGEFKVIDGYMFYNVDDFYYPASKTGVVNIAFQKKAGGVTFSDEDVVHEVPAVHKVYVTFEFEDDVLNTVLKQAVGHKLMFEGDSWEQFVDMVNNVMSTVASQIDVPKYYVYDCEGGCDYTNEVMISQWPLSDDVVAPLPTDVEDTASVEEVDIPISEEEEVNSALSFIKETPPLSVSPFAFDYYKHKDFIVLKQDSNNCWVTSACLHLQALDVLDDPALDLFKVGRVAPLVQKCYEAVRLVKGSLGDATECLEHLLAGVESCTLVFGAKCKCGKRDHTMKGCVFRFLPNDDVVEQWCSICDSVLYCTLKSIKGTAVFCQNPGPVSNVHVPAVIAASYAGGVSGGHYRTNIYTVGDAVDGFGVHKINDEALHTYCVKNVSWQRSVEPVLPEPFCTYKNVKFYRGEFKDLVALPHDFVVNAANSELKHGGGVAAAINAYTNGLLQKLSNKHVGANGKVKVCSGVMLDCDGLRVYNLVGPRKGKHGAELLLKAYKNLFSNDGVPLTPLLSVGIFGIDISTSFSSFMESVGDRACSCFCYLEQEEKAIVDLVNALIPPAPGVVQATVLEPYLIEGRNQFYDSAAEALFNADFERYVFFIKEDKALCKLACAFNELVDGACSDLLQQSGIVPAGNLVTAKSQRVDERPFAVTFAVVPDGSAKNYDKNVARVLKKLSNLKGKILATIPDATLFPKVLLSMACDFWVSDVTKCVVDGHFVKADVPVVVTTNGRDFNTVFLDTSQTFEQQLGTCTVKNVDVTKTVATVVEDVVSVAPDVDWDAFYGFQDAGVFYTLAHAAFDFESKVVEGKRVLKSSDNNCWVNATCLQLQYMNAKFCSEGLNAMWDEYMVGNVSKFVHWLYWLMDLKKSDKGDSEALLLRVSKYLVNPAKFVLESDTETGCCGERHVVSATVLNASVLKRGAEDGLCKHGLPKEKRVVSVEGTGVVVNVGNPCVVPKTALVDGVSYTAFTGDVASGHYTVVDKTLNLSFDGDDVKPADLSAVSVTAVVVKNSVFSKPSVSVVNTADVSAKRKDLPSPDVRDSLNTVAASFFSFGDVVAKNIVMLFAWLFSMLGLLFKCFKKRDLRVLAMAPERTGVILRRSLKYNCKAAYKYVNSKWGTFKFLFKLFSVVYAAYMLLFLLIRFGPLNNSVCTGYVNGYSNSSFVKNDYCSDIVCKICLYGYQELKDLPHLALKWEFVTHPLLVSIMPACYMLFLVCFGNSIVRCLMCYFVLQYVNVAGVVLGLQDSIWALQLVPFDIFCDEIVVCYVVYVVLAFLYHVCFGCEKPNCVACSKSARLTRIPVQTVVNGSTKVVYVVANGGHQAYCKKHNFFCVNCDSEGIGCTFINEHVARELANVTKTSVQPTGESHIFIDKVEFQNGFYYLYSGETFWRYNFDITESKYSCKEVLKNCNVLSDFIVYNNCGTNVSQVHNACVYLSQLLCKPIKLVDSTLLATLDVDFNGSLHSAFVELLTNSFGKDFGSCSNMAECKALLGLEVPDDEFYNAVSDAHRYNILLSDLSFNNFVTTYAKPEEKFSTHDAATCMRSGAKIVNHNILVKENTGIVWCARDFHALSEDCRKYIVKTSKQKGVTISLTFNDTRMHCTLPVVNFVCKKGGAVAVRNWFLFALVLLFGLYVSVGFINFSETVSSHAGYDFKYIKDGRLLDFTEPISCVHNVFDGFGAWFESKFGFVPSENVKCPIVVGVRDDVRTVPGIPSGVVLVGKTLVFAVKTVFGESGNCYDAQGVTTAASCIFTSACTVLSGLGGTATYCYKSGIVEGSRLYSDLLPNTHYKMDDGQYVKLPDVLARGLGFRVVRTMATTYCRAGQCVDSKAGVCFGLDRFLVYNSEYGSDFVCGNSLLALLYNVVSIFSGSFSVVALSGQIVFNMVVAAIAVMLCFTVVKFKRMFGDMSRGVCTVIAAVVVNNVSYVVTQNTLGMVIYAFLYFMATRGVSYSWIWYVGYVVAYCTLAPWWLLVWFLFVGLSGIVPTLVKLKVTTQLFDGERFVGSFENAAQGTFVLDMHSYEKLVNSIPADKLKQYAASFNRYKYYSGSANEADYRLACFAHLAKAMMDYGSDHQDRLYTPPTVSYNSTLQAGLRKMAQPSGVVEKCVVRVAYGNMVLNGVWLGDEVICPRHVLAESTTTLIDYDKAFSLVRLHNFSISVGNVFLGVLSVKMKGALLYIKVNQANVQTPTYTFKVLKPGDSFNILACYEGTAAGVYGVTLRNNHTIRGSFINGACGSPGYNLLGSVVEFCYFHQLELGSGCHVGSDANGVMYGGFEDQPTLQIEGASKLFTPNVLAFLYGALLNGCNWWVNSERVSLEAFNDWAASNDFTTVSSVDTYTILSAKTGVDVQRVLAAIQRLTKGFGGNKILGYASLTDEFTVGEVIKQMYGVTLQSSKKFRLLGNLVAMGLFVFMFWTEFLSYSALFWINASVMTPIFMFVCGSSVFLTSFLKHKLLFLHTFLVPTVTLLAAINLSWDWYLRELLSTVAGYHTSLLSFDLQGVFNVVVCGFASGLHLYRFNPNNLSSAVTLVMSMCATIYNYWYAPDYMSLLMMCLLYMSNNWYIGLAAFKVACFAVLFVPEPLVLAFGATKITLLIYVFIGYICCMYFGFCYWINRFSKLTLGVYDFKVSAAEFKYMVANGLAAPRSVFDTLYLSFRLMGVGGERTIKVATVQSKLTDLKCANVVLLGCLSSMNVAANSREWAYCVDLHNKINLADDPEHAQELLLALLAFFISKQKDFGVDELLDSYFSNTTLLQSVASTFVNMPSYVAYETARKEYEDSLNNGSSPQIVKQLKRAMNVAKAEFDKEASVQRKINRMAEAAATQMYKEARAVNRKSKVVSSLHAMLFSMLRRLDMSSIDNILSLARDGTIPLSIIPTACATKLNVVCSDLDSFAKIVLDGSVQYAGVVWNIVDIRDGDGKVVHLREVTKENVETLCWPLYLNCERMVKLQNNEIMPGKLKQKAVRAEGEGVSCDGKALYNNEGGKTFMYAFLADKPDLKYVKWEFDGGCNVIELEPPCRFAIETTNGTQIRYLYFVRNLNTLRRGAVLGYIGATVRLQAGKQTELASNSGLLTLCAFAVDPVKMYVDAVRSGTKPVGNCVKMLSNGAGSGQAITVGVEANTNQDSYGGASVCLYCRAHIEHPDMDGRCRFKGKYVQVPLGCSDPIRFCLENKPCTVCGCWVNNGCTCDRTSLQTVDQAYLNEQGALVVLD